MKKLISILLLVAMLVLSLAACGGETETDGNSIMKAARRAASACQKSVFLDKIRNISFGVLCLPLEGRGDIMLRTISG